MLTAILVLSGVVNLVCWILIIINMFKEEGALWGILSLCGLVAFIMGWAKSSDHDTVPIMTTWTGSIVVGLLCRWAGS